ncbi:MAG: ChaN family lipoprotein [Deltaproteobacteria bacterium]|nr:ChaN family lipoprotein [Deltaproteobacteria bacterium]
MTLSPRQELLTLQKRIFADNQRVIESSIEVSERGFAQYERTYQRAVARFDRAATHEEMLKAILKANIIYVGDYHTLNQSQRSFLRILKAIVSRDRNFVVGLELIHARHQKLLDRFVAGKVSEDSFLRKIRLEEHWVFDLWSNFKPLFDFCRYHHIPMLAIDAAPRGASVRVRDRATAELLADYSEHHSEQRMFVFIGDLHIAPSHLPRDVERALRRRQRTVQDLVLYQSSVKIYWELARRGLEDRVDVVRIDDRSFCRMHTPPIIAQRSYLNWLEHEEGEIDYADAKHSFLEIVDHIGRFLRIRFSPSDCESVDVFTAGDMSFLERLREMKIFSPRELAVIKRQIASSESYYIAKARVVYLANLSINHAAEEAAHFMKNVLSGPEEPREMIDAFYANVLHEALGFFGSKIVNHKRKCHHEPDFRKLHVFFSKHRIPQHRRLEAEATELLLRYLALERQGRPLGSLGVFHVPMELFLAVTHALGYMLGERLYYGLLDGVISRKSVRSLFQDPWEGEGEPFAVYWDLRQKLRQVVIPKRM